MGLELAGEVIEYDGDADGGYRARRVVRFERLDMRQAPAYAITARLPEPGEYADPEPAEVTSD